MSKISKIKWMVPIIVAVLTMGVLATGFAMPPEEGSLHGFVGTVTDIVWDTTGTGDEVSPGTLTIKTLQDETVVVALPAEGQEYLYRFKAPGRGDDVTAADILQADASVAVLAKWTGEGWEAVQVLVKPEKPATPITGAVTEVDEATLTITVTTPSGEEHTFTLPEGMEIPAVGEIVTVFLGPGEGEIEGVKVRNVARGLVRASQIRERLEKHLAEVTDEDTSDQESGFKAQLAERLRNMMQQHLERHLQVLERVQARASDKAQAALEKAKQDVAQNRVRLQQVIDKVQGRIDALKDRWQQWKVDATPTPRGARPNK